MVIISCICILVAVIAFIAIVIVSNQQSYRILLVRIDEAVKNIEYYLQKKEETLEKVIPLIKDANKRKYAKKEIMDTLIKNKNIKQNLFEKDEALKENFVEFKTLLEDDEKLVKVKDINEIYFESIDIENDLNASKKYYNRIVDKIEKDFKQFPKSVLKSILKYEKFDKFNIKKEETLEILKEEQGKK